MRMCMYLEYPTTYSRSRIIRAYSTVGPKRSGYFSTCTVYSYSSINIQCTCRSQAIRVFQYMYNILIQVQTYNVHIVLQGSCTHISNSQRPFETQIWKV